MPRETVAEFSVDRVSALDPDGTVDEALVPDLPDEEFLSMYRVMRLARRFDERAIALQRRGEIGTYAPSTGQEAAQVGCVFAMAETDWLVPAFREGPAFLARGVPASKLFTYFMGMEEGAEIPEGERSMPPAIAVGSQALHATGLGWAQAIDGLDAATVGFFGDGATSEGDVYEALNLAGVYGAHTAFLCQNNPYAISVPRSGQTWAETLAQKAVAAGIEGIQVDGNDVLGVYAVMEEALSSARSGRPVLVEALTYRRSMHTTADDPSVYRSAEEEAEWAVRDPIDRFERYLLDRGVLAEDRIAEIESEIEETLAEAIERANEERKAVDPEDMFEYAYDELPPYVEEQRAAFEERERGRGAPDTGTGGRTDEGDEDLPGGDRRDE